MLDDEDGKASYEQVEALCGPVHSHGSPGNRYR